MSAPVTSRILPMSEQDIANNTVRVEVTMPRDPDVTQRVREASLTAASGWCAPSSAIWDLRVEDGDWSEPVTVPRGGVTYSINVPNITPEALRLMWGQPPYVPQEETLL